MKADRELNIAHCLDVHGKKGELKITRKKYEYDNKPFILPPVCHMFILQKLHLKKNI